MDVETRVADARKNPAALLALMWYSTGWKKKKDMVILPYRDRLLLFSRYLQQLVMESLGKELDRNGNRVHQGIAVYGNKGSTDQHAFVQQLRDGRDNFFVTFIEVEREKSSMAAKEQVKPGFTAGDYLSGFLRGTRKALSEKGRESITIEMEQLNARGLGMLIALFERAVGLYAGLVNINAYHQPGVQAGKVAAEEVLDLQGKVLEILGEQPGEGGARTVDQIARAVGEKLAEDIFHILKRLSADPERTGVRRQGDDPTRAKYYV
jgi:glucose-6-phosphate isomerase